MLSCDTFILGKKYYDENKICFAKNSDRPLGEAQPIAFFPGGEHPEGEMLRCTHLTIPQAARTYTVLGSRPYWIWGFEMGVNEMGLVIGNEAEGSRCEGETEEGLLGMDLLRLALERAATARQGVEVIASLLETYGQNANASQLFDRRYENSFLLADREEIWLMETAGRQWAARQVRDWAAISNCYSIGTQFDLCSRDLETYARERRFLAPSDRFDFARAYTKPAARQTASVPRWRRLCKLISSHEGPLSRQDVACILRDHFDGELIEPRYGACAGGFVTICMHAAAWDGSQTAASMICTWDDDLGPVTLYAPSLPCCSVYIPVYWTGDVPDCMKQADGKYDENSLWWAAQRLAMLISVDENRFGPDARKALAEWENTCRLTSEQAQAQARARMAAGQKQQALDMLGNHTEEMAHQALRLFHALSDEISSAIAQEGGLYGIRREFLQDYTARTGLKL